MLVGYMRVSSDPDRQTTDLQRDALLSAGVDSRHLFEDHASGAKDDRCGLAKALEFVKSSDVLVVWKLDRLGRSLSHLLSIVNELKDRQAAFRSLTEGMDTTTASGELLFHVFGALAQYERALTRERVMAGLTAARRRGRVGGRAPVIVGEKLDAILAALDDGMSKAAVCRNFGSIAHFERRLISERNRDGIARGQEARSNTRATAARPGDGFRRAETHRGWNCHPDRPPNSSE